MSKDKVSKKPFEIDKIKGGLYKDDTIDKKNILYESVIETQDPSTGEVTAKSTQQVTKKPRTPDFIQMYTKGMVGLFDVNVSKDQMRVLFSILHKYVLPADNRIMMNKEIKDEISLELNITSNTINHALGALHKEQVLLKKGRGSYFLNPFIFGKGKFDDIAKLRYEVKHEYDFEKGEMRIERKRTADYIDHSKNENGYHVKDANEEITNENGIPHLKQEVEVEDKMIDPDEFYIDEELQALKELEDENKKSQALKYSGENDRRNKDEAITVDASPVYNNSDLEKMKIKLELERLEVEKIDKMNKQLEMQLELERIKQQNK
jgi:hypothetical protein